MTNKRIYLEKKVFEGRTYYFTDVGSGRHGRASFRLWVNGNLVKTDEEGKEFIEFPIENARIVKTEKGSYVLRPASGWYVFNAGIEAGYRGTSAFRVLEPEEAEIFEYVIYHSPVGSLGISHYALINTQKDKLKIKWERDGRLYGKPTEGITLYYSDGREESLEGVPDGLEAIDEIRDDAQ
jgi:hypothetical protein